MKENRKSDVEVLKISATMKTSIHSIGDEVGLVKQRQRESECVS